MTRPWLILAVMVVGGCGTTGIKGDAVSEMPTDLIGEGASDLPIDTMGEVPCIQDRDCDNGLVCDGAETCVDGVCLDGAPLDCDDGDDCTVDSCDNDFGGCAYFGPDEDGDHYVDWECGGTDCDDSRSDVHPDSIIPGCLDGIDQDCDGLVDELVTIIERVPLGPGATPNLNWTGSEFGFFIADEIGASREVFFSSISAEGVVLSSRIQISDADEMANEPASVWTGDEFALVWVDRHDGTNGIDFIKTSASGVPVGATQMVVLSTDEVERPLVSWTGSEFGIFWQDHRHGEPEIYFSRLSSEGANMTGEIRVTDWGTSASLSGIAWNGREFLVTWSMPTVTSEYISVIDTEGVHVMRFGLLPMGSGYIAPPVWTGSEYAVIWRASSFGMSGTFFQKNEPEGGMTCFSPGGGIVAMSDARLPRIIWNGSSFAATSLHLETEPPLMTFWNISLDCSCDGGPWYIDGIETYSYEISWSGSQYGITWLDEIDGEYLFNIIDNCG